MKLVRSFAGERARFDGRCAAFGLAQARPTPDPTASEENWALRCLKRVRDREESVDCAIPFIPFHSLRPA
jgi:hypothetical protein